MSSGTSAKASNFWSLIPQRVKLLIFTQVLNSFSFGFFLIYLTVYLVQTDVLNGLQVGLFLGLETIVLITAGIPIGILSDRRGRKNLLILGNSLLPLTLLIFALTTNVYWYAGAAVLAGLAEALSLGSWNAIIADQTDLTNRDASFSMSFIVGGASLSAGSALPLVLPAIAAFLGLSLGQAHSGSLLIMGICSIPVPLLIWVLLRKYHETPTGKEQPDEPGELARLIKFSAMNGVIGLGAGLIIPLLGTWLLYKFAVEDIYSGPFIALTGITIAFAAIGSPRLSKRFGLFRALLMTAGSSTLFMFSLAFIPWVTLAGVAYLFRASLMNMASPLIDSYLMSIVRPGRRGLGSAIAAIVWRLPNSVTTIIGGYILQLGHDSGNHFFYDVPWLGASALYVVGIALLYINFKNVKPKS